MGDPLHNDSSELFNRFLGCRKSCLCCGERIFPNPHACLGDHIREGGRLHRALDGIEATVEDRVDAPSDGTRRIRIPVEAEERVIPDALHRVEDIREGDLPEGARDVSAALPATCNADESRPAQLPKDVANDDGMRTDAAREAFARGGLLLSVELDGDEDVDGDGEAA